MPKNYTDGFWRAKVSIEILGNYRTKELTEVSKQKYGDWKQKCFHGARVCCYGDCGMRHSVEMMELAENNVSFQVLDK